MSVCIHNLIYIYIPVYTHTHIYIDLSLKKREKTKKIINKTSKNLHRQLTPMG